MVWLRKQRSLARGNRAKLQEECGDRHNSGAGLHRMSWYTYSLRFYISFQVRVFADRNVLFDTLIHYLSFFKECIFIRIWLNIDTHDTRLMRKLKLISCMEQSSSWEANSQEFAAFNWTQRFITGRWLLTAAARIPPLQRIRGKNKIT
jgi:hypothetical protein